MEDIILTELKDELIGDSPNTELITKITSDENARIEFLREALKVKEDTKSQLRYIYLAVISSVLHLKRYEIEGIKGTYQLGDDAILELVEVTFVLCGNVKLYDTMIFIADNYTIKDKTLIKSLIEMIRVLIKNRDFDKASIEWKKYRQFIVNDRAIYDTLKEEYNKLMTFKGEQKVRDYSIPFKINKLFDLPKDITFQKAVSEYNYNYDEKYYYTAASIAKYLKLGDAIMKKAAEEAFKLEISKFKKNLQNGVYKNWKKININDAFFMAKKITEEFDIFKLNIKKSDSEYINARNIVERIYDIFVELVASNVYEKNGTLARTYIAIKLIKEYGLNNDLLFPHIVKEVAGHTETLAMNIEKEVVDLKTGKESYDLLTSLRKLNLLEYERTDRIAQKIFMSALDNKEIPYAVKIFKEFSFRFEVVAPKVLKIIYDWAKNNDFDSILELMEHFPVKQILVKDKVFMEKVQDYYKENMNENRLLKCLSIAETFDFEKDKYINSVTSLFDSFLKSKDTMEARKLIKKYKIKREVVMESVKKNYFEMLNIDRNFAGKMRIEFGLSVFQVGLFKWFMYEVIGIKSKKEND